MYWIIFGVALLLLSLIEVYITPLRKIAGQLSLFILFIAMSGNYYNGLDWINYSWVFTYQAELSSEFILSGRYEPGFLLLLSVVKTLTNNFHWLVFIVSVVVIININFGLKKATLQITHKATLLFWLYCFMGVFLFGDLLRQSLAFSILFIALLQINYISNKRWIYYCLLGACFHFSAIIILPFKWLINKQWSQVKLLVIFFLILFLCLSLYKLEYFLPYLRFLPLVIYTKLVLYSASISNVSIGVFGVLDLLALVFLLLLKKNFLDKDNNLLWNASLLFFLLHFSFYFASFFQRLNIYFVVLLLVFAVQQLQYGIFSLRKSYYLIVTLYMSMSFLSQLLNPSYQYDWNQPKFFYTYIDMTPHDEKEFVHNLKNQKCAYLANLDLRYKSFCLW